MKTSDFETREIMTRGTGNLFLRFASVTRTYRQITYTSKTAILSSLRLG